MKIIRFMSEAREVFHGVYADDRPGFAKSLKAIFWKHTPLRNRWQKSGSCLPPSYPLTFWPWASTTKSMEMKPPCLLLRNPSCLSRPPPALPTRQSHHPAGCRPDCVDYEAELAVIIGKKAKNINPEEAMDIIFGYTCANDVSARDWQFDKQKGQWARGKSFDTFCPLGPWIVTKEEIDDPNHLAIRALLNGKRFSRHRRRK